MAVFTASEKALSVFKRKSLHTAIVIGFSASASQLSMAAQLEEVFVTAQKKSESLQDVPVAVSVVSGDDIQNDVIVDLVDVSAKIPTVKLASGVVGDLINIRGFGSGDNASFEQAAATFVDGAYRGRAASSNFAFLDMAQLEVLKGPQTVYFGANATAGAFNITTKKANPGDPLKANVSAYYEPEYGGYILEGGVSASLTDNLAGRIAVKLNGGDGFIENRAQNRDEGGSDDYAARVSLAWVPSSAYRMDVRFDVGETDRVGVDGELYSCGDFQFGYTPGPTDPVLCNAYLGYAAATGGTVDDKLDWKTDGGGARSHYKAEFSEFALTNRWDLDAGVITAVTTYYEHDSDRMASPAPYPVPNSLGEIGAFFPANTLESFEQITQEIRFETSLTDQVDITVGAYYVDGDLTFEQYQALLFIPASQLPDPSLAGIGTYFDIGVEESTYSVFSAIDYHLTETVTVNLGVRYTDVEKKGNGFTSAGLYSTGYGSPDSAYTPLPLPVQHLASGLLSLNLDGYPESSYTDTAVQPSIGVSWDMSDDVMLYGKYNEGFKSGGFGFNGPLTMFDKEEVKAYELGAKTNLLDGAMSLSLAAFFNQYDGLQEAGNRTNTSGGVETFIENVGSVEARGVELGIMWQTTENLRIDFDVAYLDSIYDEFKDATCDEITKATTGAQFCDLSGETRPFAPEWSGSLSATYIVGLDNYELKVQPSVDFTSGYNTLATLDPVGYQESYEKLNLRLAYGPSTGEWEVALIGKNLTDEYTADFRNISPSSPGTAIVWPNPPRTIGMQVNWNFE